MRRNAPLALSIVLLGVTIYVALFGFGAKLLFTAPDPDARISLLRMLLAEPYASFIHVAPAFVAGWIQRRNGGLMGTGVGALSSLASDTVYYPGQHPVSLAAGALSGAIFGAIAGLGGAYVRSRTRTL